MPGFDESKLVRSLVAHEAERQFPYRDTKGKLTIGVGHNLTDNGISKKISAFILAEDLKDVYAALDKNLPWWRNKAAGVQLALAELCFNMGIGKLLDFHKMLAAIQADNLDEAERQLRKAKWATDVGPTREDDVVATMRGRT